MEPSYWFSNEHPMKSWWDATSAATSSTPSLLSVAESYPLYNYAATSTYHGHDAMPSEACGFGLPFTQASTSSLYPREHLASRASPFSMVSLPDPPPPPSLHVRRTESLQPPLTRRERHPSSRSNSHFKMQAAPQTHNSRDELHHPLPLHVPTKNLLHRICFRTPGLHRICMVLKADPSAASRAETVIYRKKRCVFDASIRSMVSEWQTVHAPYKYPLHLAIVTTVAQTNHTAPRNPNSHDDDLFFHARSDRLDDCMLLLRLLLREAPSVLRVCDGSSRATTLAILVKEWSRLCLDNPILLQHCLQLIETMVAVEPSLVYRRDRHGNTVLHIACQNYAPVSLIQTIYYLYPDALSHENFHGLTPLEIAQQRMGCKQEQEQVVNFLKDREDETL